MNRQRPSQRGPLSFVLILCSLLVYPARQKDPNRARHAPAVSVALRVRVHERKRNCVRACTRVCACVCVCVCVCLHLCAESPPSSARPLAAAPEHTQSSVGDPFLSRGRERSRPWHLSHSTNLPSASVAGMAPTPIYACVYMHVHVSK